MAGRAVKNHATPLFSSISLDSPVLYAVGPVVIFSFILKVPLFSAGSKENKSKNKLCVLNEFCGEYDFSTNFS